MSEWIISDPVFEADQVCPMYKVWPWNGHRRFAYDLVRFTNPRRIVELGTYWGNSFFSFCQAVKDHHLRTECIAVDTWEGDSHTGAYEKEVYETVEKIVDRFFDKVDIRLLRAYFSNAINEINDKSIDILHIDGLHTYKAVKEDFELWLPKLSETGVVLFHDIADDCGYGAVKFWKEVSQAVPSFSFQHSWGLGVLFPKKRLTFDLIQNQNFLDKLKIYEYMSKLSLSELQLNDMEKFNKQQDNFIQSQKEKIADLFDENKKLNRVIKKIESSFAGKTFKRMGLLSLE